MHRLLLLGVVLMLGACASRVTLDIDGTRDRVELSQTPFFPQQDYQCGPAALAASLVASGVAVTPEELVPQIYLPAERGSLQPEMLAATRRHGRVPYVLAPRLAALLQELDGGNPVLVLQNLGARWLPVWHYAVVVGYDATAASFVLRSGTTRRKVMAADAFERSWRLGGYWGLVVLPPGRLPASATDDRYLAAVSGLEAVGRLAVAEQAYRTAIARWPGSALAWFGLGNVLYREGDRVGARQAFAKAVQLRPDDVAALNNLAQLQAEGGCPAEGLRTLARASDAAQRRPALEDVVDATRREISALPTRPGACEAIQD